MNKIGAIGKKILFVLFIAFTLFFTLFPLLWVVKLAFSTSLTQAASLKLPDFTNFDNFTKAVTLVNIPRAFLNSIELTLLTVLLELAMAVLAAYAITLIPAGKWNDRFYTFFVAGMVIPSFVVLYPGFKMSMWFGINGSYLALILMYAGPSVPFSILLLTGAFIKFPKEIEESGRIDGCSYLQNLLRVILPCVGPTVMTLFIFYFLGTYNDFMTASIMINEARRQTLAQYVFAFKTVYSSDNMSTAAYVLLIMIPPWILYIFFQRYIIDGVTAGAVKG